jgi:hypothetical protein
VPAFCTPQALDFLDLGLIVERDHGGPSFSLAVHKVINRKSVAARARLMVTNVAASPRFEKEYVANV